jgi:hypothetical protein
MQTWDELGTALDTNRPDLLTLVNGDLDTGIADNNQHIFWQNIA